MKTICCCLLVGEMHLPCYVIGIFHGGLCCILGLEIATLEVPSGGEKESGACFYCMDS